MAIKINTAIVRSTASQISSVNNKMNNDFSAVDSAINALNRNWNGSASDVFYGVVMILIGGFSIFTRFLLSKYRKNGPLFLYILYGVGAGLSLIYSIAVMSISGVNQVANGVVSVIVSAVFIIFNIKYFGKRKNLFTN